jgi:hypothetical protein
MLHLEAIETEGEIAGDEQAGVIGGKGTAELEGVARKLGGSFESEAVGVGDFKAEFSGAALSSESDGVKKNDEMEECAHL